VTATPKDKDQGQTRPPSEIPAAKDHGSKNVKDENKVMRGIERRTEGELLVECTEAPPPSSTNAIATPPAAATHEVVSWCSTHVRLATNSRSCMPVQAVDDAPAEVRMSLMTVLLGTPLMPATRCMCARPKASNTDYLICTQILYPQGAEKKGQKKGE